MHSAENTVGDERLPPIHLPDLVSVWKAKVAATV